GRLADDRGSGDGEEPAVLVARGGADSTLGQLPGRDVRATLGGGWRRAPRHEWALGRARGLVRLEGSRHRARPFAAGSARVSTDPGPRGRRPHREWRVRKSAVGAAWRRRKGRHA